MRHLIGSILAMLVCGCSTMVVNSYSSGTADFSKLKTYAWMLGPQGTGAAPWLGQNPDLDRVVHEIIDEALAKRGYVKSTTGNPDFLVSYHATLNKKVSVETLDQASGYKSSYLLERGGSRLAPMEDRESIGREYVDTFDEGTLIIDLVDPKSNQLIWRGTAK